MIRTTLPMYNKIVLLEDDVFHQVKIEEMLEGSSFELVKSFSSVKGLFEFIQKTGPCILICDLFIDGKPEGARFILQNNFPNCEVIAITMSTDEEIFQSLIKKIPYYLIKPFHKLTLLSTLNQIALTQVKEPSGYLLLSGKNSKKKERVLVEHILYIEAKGNYITFYCNNNQKFCEKVSLKKYLETHPLPSLIRVHQNFAINLTKVKSLESQFIQIEPNIRIPISKTYKQNITVGLNI